MRTGNEYQEQWLEAILKAHLVKTAMDDYELVFKKFLHGMWELEEGDFWQLQQVLMEDILVFGLEPTIACIEFFYRPVDDKFDDSVPRYTAQDANRFVLSWHMKEARTKDYLTQQNLPPAWAYAVMMCNEDVFNRLYNGEIDTEKKFNSTCEDMARSIYSQSVKAQVLPDEHELPSGLSSDHIVNQLAENILKQGEQLDISSRLETAARAAFAEAARQEHGNDKTGTTQPDIETEGTDS